MDFATAENIKRIGRCIAAECDLGAAAHRALILAPHRRTLMNSFHYQENMAACEGRRALRHLGRRTKNACGRSFTEIARGLTGACVANTFNSLPDIGSPPVNGHVTSFGEHPQPARKVEKTRD
ncbi:MAG: hypothetical protein PSV22_02055 [Pseudolabrys sp.]|nr:hypothetical protein [Pseudolabrys sp.]